MHQNARLSSSRAGKHQHRTRDVVSRLLLLRVQLRIRDSHKARFRSELLCERKAKSTMRKSADRRGIKAEIASAAPSNMDRATDVQWLDGRQISYCVVPGLRSSAWLSLSPSFLDGGNLPAVIHAVMDDAVQQSVIVVIALWDHLLELFV